MPASLPAGTHSLPPLGGRLFVAYRLTWWLLLAAAVLAVGSSALDANTNGLIIALRLAKSAVLIAVAWILLRRRPRDPVAALFGISFLLWTISSSGDFTPSNQFDWRLLVDRLRFLPFATGLLFFPDGRWQMRRTAPIAGAIFTIFFIGVAEATGLLATQAYLPLAVACVLAALASLLNRYRSLDLTQQQQFKWIALGLVTGIGLILSARAGAALFPGGPKSMAQNILLEAMFQLGVVIIALGFLTSLLRYRLYDAETAISRSAAYAGLTLALVGTFSASETIIQTVGQRYFGSGIGDLSGGIAAAIAAVLLTPLHGRISGWAEQYFQRDLIGLKSALPDLLDAPSLSASVSKLSAAVLPLIEGAVHAERSALVVDGRLVGARGVTKIAAQRWIEQWDEPTVADPFDRDDGALFPLRMAMRCPLGRIRAWLLLGPRPDGSFYGKDDLDALAEIVRPLQRALVLVAEREIENARQRRIINGLSRSIAELSKRLEKVEKHDER
ncbi:hypothetical protein [Sphingomonas sp.]|uniref:hypothetical protein n=1 Tax=Sphingomonas sp. TaxID=28214 RepID=UPI0025D2A029|nr:hypothetical protein [Sphingomonas sp.]